MSKKESRRDIFCFVTLQNPSHQLIQFRSFHPRVSLSRDFQKSEAFQNLFIIFEIYVVTGRQGTQFLQLYLSTSSTFHKFQVSTTSGLGFALLVNHGFSLNLDLLLYHEAVIQYPLYLAQPLIQNDVQVDLFWISDHQTVLNHLKLTIYVSLLTK